ncbi:hypothetical protein HDE_00138 [Halotydeus destructor]|nr:hypothetical protein HDE_00138 [Halotydeus destructor]
MAEVKKNKEKEEKKSKRKQAKYLVYRNVALVNLYVAIINLSLISLIVYAYSIDFFANDEEKNKFMFMTSLLVTDLSLALIMFFGWRCCIKYFIAIYILLVPVYLITTAVHMIVYMIRFNRCTESFAAEPSSAINELRCYWTPAINAILFMINLILTMVVISRFNVIRQNEKLKEETKRRVGWFVTLATAT